MRKRNPEVCDAYRWTHQRCALCGIPEYATPGHRFPAGLQLAHVLGGSSRFDIPANLLMLCSLCHTDQHGGHAEDLDHRHLILLKQELGELDLPALCEIAMRPASYFEECLELELPQRYQKERQRWHATSFSR